MSLDAGKYEVLHLATTFQIGVYASQLGNLKDVSDPVTMDVIRFYDQLSNLERIKSHLTSTSIELTKLSKDSAEDIQKGETIVYFYASALGEVIMRVARLVEMANNLIARLPV